MDLVFGPSSTVMSSRIRAQSRWGERAGWRYEKYVVKKGEDVRREALVMQVLERMRDLRVLEEGTFKPYTIMCTGEDEGILECVPDTVSLSEAKEVYQKAGYETLREFFLAAYGGDDTQGFKNAQDNFIKSLVGYSLLCYILQVKDRHNANILLARDGSIIHIDFGYVLGDVPKMGRIPVFQESQAFKMTKEVWDVIGGWGGRGAEFCERFERGFRIASLHSPAICAIIESGLLLLSPSLNSLPARRRAKMVTDGVGNRLRIRRDLKAFVGGLVETSLNSYGTSTYDWLQRNMNGYNA